MPEVSVSALRGSEEREYNEQCTSIQRAQPGRAAHVRLGDEFRCSRWSHPLQGRSIFRAFIWFSQSENFLGGTSPKTNLVPAIPFPRIIYIVLKWSLSLKPLAFLRHWSNTGSNWMFRKCLTGGKISVQNLPLDQEGAGRKATSVKWYYKMLTRIPC